MRSRRLRRGAAILIASLIALSGLVLYIRLFAGDVRQRLVSPDGMVIAEVRTLDFAAATDGPNTAIELRTKNNPFRHSVFSGLDYGAKITVSWIDAKSLLVRCEDCAKLSYGNTRQDKWHEIEIHYDLQNWHTPQSSPGAGGNR